MAIESDGVGGDDGDRVRGKRRRRADEQGGQRKEEAAPVVRISALPDDLRRRILARLPLKDAIRTGALAQGWRDLWKSRWSESTSCLDVHLLPGDKPTEVLRNLLESHPRRRLDRFSLVVDNQKFRNHHLRRLLAYAAECRVEDLRIELRCCKPSEKFIYHLPLSSPLLAHLSLRNINIGDLYYKDARPFSALEVIRLHSVTSSVRFNKVLVLCPRLRILDLRRCYCGHIYLRDDGGHHMLSPYSRVTIAECYGETRLHTVVGVQRIRSFRYSGKFFDYRYNLPRGAAPTDLYICLGEPVPPGWWSAILPDDLSALTVLTVCSNALKVVASCLSKDRPNCQWDKMSKLQSLKELQLLMLGMEMHNLADIYALLKSCHFSNLERLFVQLPATSDVPLMDLVEEVSIDLPGDRLVKLGMVKVINFNWRRFEVELVCLLLRKATTLNRLLLVSPNVAPLHVPGVQEADLLLLKEALASGRIIVSESDDPAIQPFHPEVSIEE